MGLGGPTYAEQPSHPPCPPPEVPVAFFSSVFNSPLSLLLHPFPKFCFFFLLSLNPGIEFHVVFTLINLE